MHDMKSFYKTVRLGLQECNPLIPNDNVAKIIQNLKTSLDNENVQRELYRSVEGTGLDYSIDEHNVLGVTWAITDVGFPRRLTIEISEHLGNVELCKLLDDLNKIIPGPPPPRVGGSFRQHRSGTKKKKTKSKHRKTNRQSKRKRRHTLRRKKQRGGQTDGERIMELTRVWTENLALCEGKNTDLEAKVVELELALKNADIRAHNALMLGTSFGRRKGR
jgi:hypothetical protein